MNRETIFVFKPLSTGLGLEHSHQLRNSPGRWSLPTRRSRRQDSGRQVALAANNAKGSSQSNFPKASSRTRESTQETQVRAPLLFWQRCLALWCDGMVTLMLSVFVLIAAGLFAALFEAKAYNPSALMSVIASLDWIRQSGQMVMSLVNLGAVLPWLPVCGLVAMYLTYRLSVKIITGISLGEWFARWVIGGVRVPTGRI